MDYNAAEAISDIMPLGTLFGHRRNYNVMLVSKQLADSLHTPKVCFMRIWR